MTNEVSKELMDAAEKYRRDTCNEACKQGILDINPSPSIKSAFISGAEWMKAKMMEEAIEFECIGKKVKMTVQELINYYIDSECCDVADECGF